MWKIALIAWIIFIVLKRLFHILIDGMSSVEKQTFLNGNTLPLHIQIVGAIMLLEFVASVILTIITIAML